MASVAVSAIALLHLFRLPQAQDYDISGSPRVPATRVSRILLPTARKTVRAIGSDDRSRNLNPLLWYCMVRSRSDEKSQQKKEGEKGKKNIEPLIEPIDSGAVRAPPNSNAILYAKPTTRKFFSFTSRVGREGSSWVLLAGSSLARAVGEALDNLNEVARPLRPSQNFVNSFHIGSISFCFPICFFGTLAGNHSRVDSNEREPNTGLVGAEGRTDAQSTNSSTLLTDKFFAVTCSTFLQMRETIVESQRGNWPSPAATKMSHFNFSLPTSIKVEPEIAPLVDGTSHGYTVIPFSIPAIRVGVTSHSDESGSLTGNWRYPRLDDVSRVKTFITHAIKGMEVWTCRELLRARRRSACGDVSEASIHPLLVNTYLNGTRFAGIVPLVGGR
ncbi:hypothetical protein EDB86DRAFT_2834945 [Lactarius hatsudake]|nr:hypothetical protein EDB86DRAFT_2834945 [Lactarius hatsudake]